MSMGKKARGKMEKHVTGVVDITKSGMGYVMVEGRKEDILIRPGDLNKAMDGDTVKVRVRDGHKNKRAEGVIIEIVERRQKEFIGQIEVSEHFAFFVPASEQDIPDFYIAGENLNGAKDKDIVIVKLIGWGKGERRPEGKVISIVSVKNSIDLAMKEIIVQNGFDINFPKEVLKAVDALDTSMPESNLSGRRDFRDVFTITIDPVDAKDFDDALSVKKMENSEDVQIGIHIADVSHFVLEGSVLDAEAYKRATSVYLPDRVVPMLPEKISNELCSLRPEEEKYCFSAVFVFSENNRIKDSWFGKTVIRSDHRFNYDEVQKIIETGNGIYKDEIFELHRIAKKLREERFRKGAINFSSIELKFLLDSEGKPKAVLQKESKEANQLVEEFMLVANREVANFVSKFKANNEHLLFPYRVHDKPDKEKLRPFAAFAKKFGYHFNLKDEKGIAQSFNQMLNDVKGKPEQHVLEQLGIRTMAKAEYQTENIGHYGLGFKDYCHFTSPIRRYPDVMVHRILNEILNGKPSMDKKMPQKCKHCSEQERAAMEAERAGGKYEQVLFMKDKVGQTFEGVISGVAVFGFWVETVNEKCEGLVSVKDLADYDDFRHDETEYSLIGLRTGRRFRMGDKVRVLLVAANLEKKQLDFEWVPANSQIQKRKAYQRKRVKR